MKRVIIAVVVAALTITAFTVWWKVSLSSVDPANPKTQTFVIAKGDGVREIAKKLHDEGLIRDQIAFFLLVKKLSIEKNIQAGTYLLSPSLSAQDLANKLTTGTEDVWITIPEGWRTEQIVEYLAPKFFPNLRYEEVQEWRKFEGKLFPDTYSVPKESSISAILDLMRANFSKKVPFPVSDNQLIIASLVEREARAQQDRPKVSSVIYNRLKAGMALDVDATVQYALGKVLNDSWWKKELTADDLKVASPYNTYLDPGLPPSPICNPGLSAIQAAANPAQTDFLFYLTGKDGQMHYARTLEEHSANVAKYLQ